MKSVWLKKFIRRLAVFGLFCMMALSVVSARAQDFLDPWDPPRNLSQSSATSNPKMVIDPTGRIHVIWTDTYVDGLVYSGWDGENWSPPVALQPAFPVTLDTFKMVSDSAGAVHMLWIGETGNLYYSRTSSSAFSQVSLWTSQLQLATAVASFDVAVSPADDINVAYLHGGADALQPAGIYTVRKPAAATTWSNPVTLDVSPYYRDADSTWNVKVTTGQDGQVYSAWDNRATAQILFRNTFDRGENWEPLQSIDNRDLADDPESVNPQNVHLAALNEKVLLLWKAGHFGSLCEAYFKSSSDGGRTWTDTEQMPDDFQGCWTSAVLFPRGNESLFALADTEIGTQMIAWDGGSWSEAEFELVLSYFPHPTTSQSVDLGCLNVGLDPNNRLYVVGCETSGTQDVWITSRDLGPLEDWYPGLAAPSVWERTIELALDEIPTNITLKSDSTGIIHILLGFEARPSLRYGRWDGDSIQSGIWSTFVAVLNSTTGIAGRPSLAIGPENELLVALTTGADGEVSFGSTGQLQGLISTDWGVPLPISPGISTASNPDLVADRDGTLYLVYAVTVNEGRGIYLTQSYDLGLTWTEPALVFDGAANGWDIVDRPRLALTSGGSLHVIWNRFTLDPIAPGTVLATGLYYASSPDYGATWSPAIELSHGDARLSAIVGLPNGTIHRAWQEYAGDTVTIWHDFSGDDGQSWSELDRVSNTTSENDQFAMIVDPAGQVHLLEIGKTNIEGQLDLVLQQRVWKDANWSVDNRTVLTGDIAYSMAAAFGPDGHLVVVYAGQPLLDDSEAYGPLTLYRLHRSYALPEIDPSLLETNATSTPEPTLTPTAEPTPVSTVLPEFPTEQDGSTRIPLDNNLTGLLLGFGAAVLTIGLIIIAGTRINRNRNL